MRQVSADQAWFAQYSTRAAAPDMKYFPIVVCCGILNLAAHLRWYLKEGQRNRHKGADIISMQQSNTS
jgi:hypothetical protein